MHRYTRRRWTRIAIALSASLLSQTQALAGSELRVGYPSDILSEDPADHRDRWTEIILRNSFDGLLTRDASMRLVNGISESWRQVAPRIYEFHLRNGIRFHDGRPLTAEDVVFTFERLIKFGGLDHVLVSFLLVRLTRAEKTQQCHCRGSVSCRPGRTGLSAFSGARFG